MSASLKRAVMMKLPDSIRQRALSLDSLEQKRTDSVMHKRLLSGSYFTYTGSYISKLEGQYDVDNLFQHVFSYGSTVQLTKELPVQVMLSGRKTNSPYFRDYVDFTIDARPELIARQIAGQSIDKQRNRVLTEANAIKSVYGKRLDGLDALQHRLSGLLTDSCLAYYVRSRELLASEGYYRDSLSFPDQEGVQQRLGEAKRFVALYDSVHHLVDSLKQRIDGFVNTTKLVLSDIDKAKEDLRSGTPLKAITPAIVRYGKDITGFDSLPLQEKTHWLQGFRRLALGRSMVDGSSLTMRDISIKGIQTEYQAAHYFYALTAGWTDFGLRDFVGWRNGMKLNSLVYAATVGKGNRDNNFVSLGVFGGQKSPGSVGFGNQDSGYVWGVSIGAQYRLRYWTVNAELAQSNGYRQQEVASGKVFDFKDKSNKAGAVAVSGMVRAIALQLSGYVRYYGVNFQGFNAYRINAANTLWGIEASKSFFRQSLQVEAAVKANDYRNPYVPQVYDGKNTIQTFGARFRKGKLTIAASYKPVYQYLGVNDSLYEGRFQVLQGMASVTYKTGEVPSASSLLFNRFVSRQAPQQYFFGSSYNAVATQSFFFPKHSVMISTSYLTSVKYTYWLVDASLQYRLRSVVSVKMGGRMHALQADVQQTRVGAYGGTYFSIKHIGQFSLRCESNYFPDLQYRLYGNTMATVGFSTQFK